MAAPVWRARHPDGGPMRGNRYSILREMQIKLAISFLVVAVVILIVNSIF